MRENASADNPCSHKKAPLGVGPMFPSFSEQGVADDCLGRVIEVARLAPSEWNLQTWRWIVVRGDAAKKYLEAASYIKVPLSSAPVILICLADTLPQAGSGGKRTWGRITATHGQDAHATAGETPIHRGRLPALRLRDLGFHSYVARLRL
ncbi:MAG: nitroreductase family protein [Terriglobia bacterium]|jgi:nitroreductase